MRMSHPYIAMPLTLVPYEIRIMYRVIANNEVKARNHALGRPKNPVRVSVSKDIHQEVEGWASFDPWGGALDILCSRSPLEMVRHPLGWVIVNYTKGMDYRVCDGPYATRTEARQAVGEWTEVRRMLDAEKKKGALEEGVTDNLTGE